MQSLLCLTKSESAVRRLEIEVDNTLEIAEATAVCHQTRDPLACGASCHRSPIRRRSSVNVFPAASDVGSNERRTVMQIGMIGLGRMGANMVARLMGSEHAYVGYDHDAQSVREVSAKGAFGTTDIADLCAKPDKPRASRSGSRQWWWTCSSSTWRHIWRPETSSSTWQRSPRSSVAAAWLPPGCSISPPLKVGS